MEAQTEQVGLRTTPELETMNQCLQLVFKMKIEIRKICPSSSLLFALPWPRKISMEYVISYYPYSFSKLVACNFFV